MTTDLIQALHACPWQGVLHVTGGGSGLLQQLLTAPGASASVLEATIPYSAPALEGLIGRVDSASDPRVAGGLGMKALTRAAELQGTGDADHLFGFGLTAALSTNRERRGENRAHMSVQTRLSTHRLSVHLAKGEPRQVEEACVSDLALAFLHHVLCEQGHFDPQLPADLSVSLTSGQVTPGVAELALGSCDTHCMAVHSNTPKAIFSGAFDPFHQGHEAMLAAAHRRLGCDVALELCIANADKPPLDYVDISRRVDALAGKGDLWLTRLPLFSDKAEAFAGVTFVVGVDTMARIADLRFYDDAAAREASFARLAKLGARFLVFGRQMPGGFQTLADLDIPQSLGALSQGVAESEFRHDISSTALRKRSSTSV